MDLEAKVTDLSLTVERNKTEIKGLQETQKKHGEKLDNVSEKIIAMQTAQETRDKSMNRFLGIITVLTAVMPWLAKLI